MRQGDGFHWTWTVDCLLANVVIIIELAVLAPQLWAPSGAFGRNQVAHFVPIQLRARPACNDLAEKT